MQVRFKVALSACLLAGVLAGCVETSALNPAAQGVRVVSQEQAKSCKFLDSVSTNSGNTLNEHPEQEARVRAMNRVAEFGGNALRIVSTNQQMSTSGIGSLFLLNGEAYLCR
jgi:hypothetical protein